MKEEDILQIIPDFRTKLHSDTLAILNPYLAAAFNIVKKVWGFEVHVINNYLFSCKLLVFYRGGKLSTHSHKLKSEQFVILLGQLGLSLGEKTEKKSLISVGESIFLPTLTYHSLEAFSDAIILEIATEDFSFDSYRLDESSYNPNNQDNIKNYQL